MSGALPSVSGVILAAGFSTRMGRPKASLEYRGETFLDRLVRLFRLHCEDVIVVTSQAGNAGAGRAVVNPAPERGMLSSLQCGLAAVRPEARAVVFTPVDYPAIQEGTIERVIRGWSGELLRIPRCEGRRGHPILISSELVAEFMALPVESQAREVVRRHEQDIVYVDVDDPGILHDVDTPADYGQLA